MSAEAELWAGVFAMGAWPWWIKAAFAAAACVALLMTDPPPGRAAQFSRWGCIVGLGAVALSPFNTALGPIGDWALYPSLALATWLRAPALRVERDITGSSRLWRGARSRREAR